MRYSNDLRALFVKHLEGGKKIPEIVGLLCIGEDTLYRWQKQHEAGTLFEVNRQGGPPTVYDYEGLKQFVQNNPDLHLSEINEQFFKGKASTSGIWDALRKMDFRLKKKSNYTKKGMKKKETNLTKKFRN